MAWSPGEARNQLPSEPAEGWVSRHPPLAQWGPFQLLVLMGGEMGICVVFQVTSLLSVTAVQEPAWVAPPVCRDLMSGPAGVLRADRERALVKVGSKEGHLSASCLLP